MTKQPGAVQMADIKKEDHDAAIAATRAEAGKTGATSERQRIAAITDSEAGKSRPSAARALALDTDIAADAAIALLAKMPVEGSTATTTPAATTPSADEALRAAATAAAAAAFEAAMNRTPNPNLHVSGSGGAGDGAKPDPSSELLAAYTAVSGYGLKPVAGARH